MKLNEKYRIVCEDVNNVVLQELKEIKKKDGSATQEWKDVAYCVNVASALKTVIDREINGSGVEDLKQFTRMYHDLRDYVDEVFAVERAEIISSAKEQAAMIINDAEVEAGRIKARAKKGAKK